MSLVDGKASAKFSFLALKGAAFTHHKGEVRWFQESKATIVEVDTDGNGKADFQIELAGRLTLSKGDFIL